MAAELYIGCAGWSIPKPYADRFPATGTHLERYAARLPCVEINSSFYRPHRQNTYQRWHNATPDAFRFAVKMPKEITHTRRLQECEELLPLFLEQIEGLGHKLGACLIQLPPSLALQPSVAQDFFAQLRQRFAKTVVCEPRHPSWFQPLADDLLQRHRVARVAADPAVVPVAIHPGGWPAVAYFRLHGSPRMYYSTYESVYLDQLADRFSKLSEATSIWCIFDNTAAAAATDNALGLLARLGRGS